MTHQITLVSVKHSMCCGNLNMPHDNNHCYQMSHLIKKTTLEKKKKHFSPI